MEKQPNKEELEESYKKFLEYQKKKTKRTLIRASIGVLMIFGGLIYVWYKTSWDLSLALFITMWGANIENRADEPLND